MWISIDDATQTKACRTRRYQKQIPDACKTQNLKKIFHETCWKNGIILSHKVYMTHRICFTFIDPIIDPVCVKLISKRSLSIKANAGPKLKVCVHHS